MDAVDGTPSECPFCEHRQRQGGGGRLAPWNRHRQFDGRALIQKARNMTLRTNGGIAEKHQAPPPHGSVRQYAGPAAAPGNVPGNVPGWGLSFSCVAGCAQFRRADGRTR